MEKAAVHSLVLDPFAPKTNQKTALGFNPSETKEAHCWTSALWNFRPIRRGVFHRNCWTLRLETANLVL